MAHMGQPWPDLLAEGLSLRDVSRSQLRPTFKICACRKGP